MALKNLIDNQTIRIDDHKRGNREQKNWDDKSKDVHVDKSTNIKVNGKRQKVQIRIPINSDRPIKISNKNDQVISIPKSLEREIIQALENKEKREAFVSDILNTIREFP